MPNSGAGATLVGMRGMIFFIAVATAFAQSRTVGTLNVRDFGRTSGDGKTDDTAIIASCVQQARTTGGYCVLPPGDYKVTRTIKIAANPPTPKAADISVIGISGTGHAVSPEVRTGSRIICAMRDGSPCLDIDVTNFSILTLYLSQLYFVGPDSSPTGAVSGEAIRIHGGSEPRVIADDLGFSGFYGAGKFAFSAEGPEGGDFRNLYCAYNNACFHGFNAFNGDIIENIYATHSSGPDAVLIETADALTWTGGILQANAGTALRLHGVIASSFRGTHFECDNVGFPINCSKPSPKQGSGAIVIEATKGVANEYDSFENLVMNGAEDRVIAHSSDGAGASTFLTFTNFYNASVQNPKLQFDSSTSHFEGHGVAGPDQYSDGGTDNAFCLGSACSSKPSQNAPATVLPDGSVGCNGGKSLRSVKLLPGGMLAGVCN